MEALLASLISKYGFEYAAKLLGLDKQKQNPKYAISLGGLTLDPVNMGKRFALNTGIKSAVSGNLSGIMGPAALLGGAFFLGQRYNPLNPKAVNYNPNLQQEINFASSKGYITKNPGTGLMQYGPGSVLAGQNVASMFGTNSYLGQLEKKKDYFENRLAKGKNISQSRYAQTLDEISEAKGFTRDKAKTKDYGPHRGNQGNNNNNTSSNTSSSKGSSIGSGHSGSGYQGRSGSHHLRKGGIASL